MGPALGPALRRRLIERGFRGDPDARPTSPHHLAPIVREGILVEIHTGIAAPFWGLPEAEMLARAQPLGPLERLDTLDAEGLLLHAMVHCSQNVFSHGLRAAWDVLAILRMSPELDWDRLARWVSATRVPRGFWVPTAVLARELGLPVPPDFLRGAPRDALQRDLEAIARRRLFRVAERVGELDPFSRNAVLLLLHDSFRARARYLGTLCRWAAVRPRGRRRAPAPSSPGGQDFARRGGTSISTAGPSRAPPPTRTDRPPACGAALRGAVQRGAFPSFWCQRATASPVVNQTPGKPRM